MKIKCKKCKKRFDPDIYSGLCPKCGTYNGAHMDETDLTQYLSSSYSGEEAHQKLHEMYEDTGHNGESHRKLHENYDRSYRTAHPVHTKTDREKKSGGMILLCMVLVLLLVLVPVFCAFTYQEWKKSTLYSLLEYEVYSQEAAEGNSLVLEGGLLEHPIHVTVLEAEEVPVEEYLQEGKMLVKVKASIASEDYNYETVLEVALQYQSGENIFYQAPLDEYVLQDYLSLLEIDEEDLLSDYNPGNGQESRGYYYFIADEGAQDMRLFLSLREDSVLRSVFKEADIALESVWNGEAGKGDTE